MPLSLAAAVEPGERGRPLDVVAVHEEHADFVCLTLQRFGVRGADVEDQLQEVFLVVHRRLHTFDGSSRMRTWLYGICMRVAAGHRNRAYHRRERGGDDGSDALEAAPAETASPEEAAVAAERRARLIAILDSMELEARGLFVMFELDEVPCDEIAEVLGVPIGTVYSRLHAARKAFQAAVARFEARDASTHTTRPRGAA